MMQFRDGPEADATLTPSNTPERAPAGTSVVQAVYTIIGLDEAMLANRIRVAGRFGGRYLRLDQLRIQQFCQAWIRVRCALPQPQRA
jgi:hypothetical protein